MTHASQLTTEVPPEVLHAVQSLAAEYGMTPEQLAGEFVRRAVEGEAELRAAIAQGRREIAAGDFLSHEELVADLRRWRQQRRLAA